MNETIGHLPRCAKLVQYPNSKIELFNVAFQLRVGDQRMLNFTLKSAHKKNVKLFTTSKTQLIIYFEHNFRYNFRSTISGEIDIRPFLTNFFLFRCELLAMDPSCTSTLDFSNTPCPVYDRSDCRIPGVVTTCKIISNRLKVPCRRIFCQVLLAFFYYLMFNIERIILQGLNEVSVS